jgi:hypothetical protein
MGMAGRGRGGVFLRNSSRSSGNDFPGMVMDMQFGYEVWMFE